MPDLEVPRMYLATCAQGTSVYAICGFGTEENNSDKKVAFNTIEVLRNASNEADMIEDWEVIQLAKSALSPRNSPVAVAMNNEEIAICGGYNGAKWHGDLILFNTTTGKVKKVVESDGQFCFYSYDNQTVVPKQNTMIALVQYPNRQRLGLMEFTNEKGLELDSMIDRYHAFKRIGDWGQDMLDQI